MNGNCGFSAVDLFCGIGGLTHGLIKSGVRVKAGYDIDPTSRYPYEFNNKVPFIEKDINCLTSREVNGHFDDENKKILVGCAPCQPFSSHTQKIKNREKGDKWNLLYSFARIIRSIEPEIISMENVSNLTRFEPFKDFKAVLEKMGYCIDYSVVNCADYGIPQYRKRLVLLASKLGDISLIPPTHSPENYVTVRDAIGNLERIECGEISKIYFFIEQGSLMKSI